MDLLTEDLGRVHEQEQENENERYYYEVLQQNPPTIDLFGQILSETKKTRGCLHITHINVEVE